MSVVYPLLFPFVLKKHSRQFYSQGLREKQLEVIVRRVESERTNLETLICTRPVRKLANRLINAARPKMWRIYCVKIGSVLGFFTKNHFTGGSIFASIIPKSHPGIYWILQIKCP